MYRKNKHPKVTNNSRKRKLLIIGIPIAAALLLAGGIFAYRATHPQATSGEIKTTSPSPNPASDPSDDNSQDKPDSTDTPAVNDKNPGSTSKPDTTTEQTLESGPSGTFVSNHRPNLSGEPAPSQVQSVCLTKPGASCTITFTLGDVVKNLPTKQADSSGSAIWTWDVKDAGFTPGSWKITATATLGGSSKSTSDTMNLEVQP